MKYPLHSATGPQPIYSISICILYSIHCIPLEADVVHKKLQLLCCIGGRRLRCVQEWERLRRSAKPKCKSIQSIGADFSEDVFLELSHLGSSYFFSCSQLDLMSIDQGKVKSAHGIVWNDGPTLSDVSYFNEKMDSSNLMKVISMH